MDSINLHILTPNKQTNRFFGVDYFMNILTGSNNLFKYYSTTLDYNPVYKEGPISYLPEMLTFLELELIQKPKGSIIGIQPNPDIYEGMDSILPIIKLLDKYEMGLYLETNSQKIINDLEYLEDFKSRRPLLVATSQSSQDIKSTFFGKELIGDNANKIIQKVASKGISCGLIIKPIIPMINDQLDDFLKVINTNIEAGVNFIYPALSIKFDSKKIKAFYDIIDMEFPQNLVKYHEMFGQKTTWESDNISILKKNFVILCKKNKILYAMKDIINLYKPDLNIQLRLF